MSISNDHGSQGPALVGICIAFAVLTIIVLTLRLFARLYVLGSMGIDDYLIIGACFLAWAFVAVTILAVGQGLGQHYEYMDKSKLECYLFVVWLSSIFYLACLGFVKTSVLCFYTRLGDRYLTRISYIMIGVIVCQATAFVLVAAFQCQPIKMAWHEGPRICVDINVFYLCNAALNILTDLLTYTLPIRVIFKLQMPRNQQIALLFILCLGLLACISSIVRITYIPAMLGSADPTYAISGAMYWSVIETNIAIFAASIPSFKAIASRFLPHFIGEKSSGGQKYHRWSGSKRHTRVTAPNNIPMGGINGKDDMRIGTQIGVTNSSEERIIPDGKIFTHTEIQTSIELKNDYATSSMVSAWRKSF